MEKSHIRGATFRTAFLLILVTGVSTLFLAVIWPFLQALLFGAIFAAMGKPLFHFLLRPLRDRRGLASALTLVIMIFVIVGPVTALLGMVVNQALEIGNDAAPWIQEQTTGADQFDAREWLGRHVPALSAYLPSRVQMAEHTNNALKALGAYVVACATTFTKGTIGFLLNAFVMLYAMFFFLKDGRKILETILYYVPLNHHDELLMLERFSAITNATIKGTLVISLIQGTLAGLAFLVAGINGAIFWGAIMVVLAILPGIGTAIVWIPAVIYLYMSGQTMTATLLTLWCAGVVGTIDNILRPRLVGKDSQMPDLMILLGTLGGLYFFGPLGFVVGPVICGMFLTVWEMYGAAFRDILPPVKSLRPHQPKAADPS